MDASQIEPCVGKTNDMPEVIQLLTAAGVTKALKPSSDGDTYVELPKIGLSLVFERVDRKSSKLKLAEAQLHSGTDGTNAQFAGALPRGLVFSDTKVEVRKKLGTPTDARDKYRIDHWIENGKRLSVEYHHETSQIAMVSLGLPM